MAALRSDRLSAAEQRLCSAIKSRERALLDDLRLHVALPTGGRNGAALDETRERLTARLGALGAGVALAPGDPAPDWLHGRTPGEAPPPTALCSRLRSSLPRVLLAGHLDTVHDPGGSFRELSIDPGRGTAMGPGCVDMKGGLVIAVAALECLDEVGIDCGWTFVLNSDEETGSYHSDRALASEARRHDVGLAVEPALPGGELAIERMGSGQFCLRAYGRSAHVGRDFTAGVSAVTALARTLVRVAELPRPEAGIIASVGPLFGGNATNAVPDFAAAWGNVRFADGQGSARIAAALDALATAPDAMPRVEVLRSFNRPAKPLLPATQRLALLARAAAEDLGQTLDFARTGGVCDGNQLQAAGLPTIDTLGVRGGGLHTPQEWIDLSSLVERCQLLAVLLARLAGGAFGHEVRERR
ncbi:MAG TPA: M20/M25/M40 family metallo-hydrolase [Phycisphaerales bacterium]|nr:M20/M25/M40 family metallo-hydrolase [Phycisphaerales bacterium]